MATTEQRPEDPLLQFPGYLLRRASLASTARLSEQLGELSLKLVEFSLLQVIGTNPGIKQSEACQVLDVQRANMAPLIAGLEKRGLVSRTPIDGRSQGISLTRSGRALAAKSFGVVTRFEEELLASIPEASRKHVGPILTAMWESCAGVKFTASMARAS